MRLKLIERETATDGDAPEQGVFELLSLISVLGPGAPTKIKKDLHVGTVIGSEKRLQLS